MKYTLFWRMCTVIGVGTVLLFWAIDWLTNHTESSMSFIAKEHQQQLLDYGKEADEIWANEGEEALSVWVKALQEKEQTWVGVVTSNLNPIADSTIYKPFFDRFQYGRSVEWKIHLYFQDNPVMEIPFADANTHLLIELPQRMRPGAMLLYANAMLQIALPLILLCILSLVLYRHVMSPLRKLENVTKSFSAGHYDVRTNASLLERNDELTRLAVTFDKMADRTSKLIYNQRQLLADLSHELRTPLTRIDMAVDFVEQQINPQQALARLRYEASTMRNLVEDTLTLAWLNTESPQLNAEDFDLVELIQVICEDARFEYPDKNLVSTLPEKATLTQSSQIALGQAIENIIRNALRHTPEKSEVEVLLSSTEKGYRLCVKDNGPGVPEHMLGDIFKPFFRVDKARVSKGERIDTSQSTGFGLGLALAHRQIEAVGGTIKAQNYIDDACSYTGKTLSEPNKTKQRSGLKIQIELPAS
jgi:two-component system sensor histidine kinase PfeS